MVDALSGDPLGSGERSAVRLSVLVAIAQGDIAASCPHCGENDAQHIDFELSTVPSECVFECDACNERFVMNADEVWPKAFVDICDRAYD